MPLAGRIQHAHAGYGGAIAWGSQGRSMLLGMLQSAVPMRIAAGALDNARSLHGGKLVKDWPRRSWHSIHKASAVTNELLTSA